MRRNWKRGLLPSNDVLIFDHLVNAVVQRVWNVKSLGHTTSPSLLSERAGTETDLVG
jgi:hypothetical protein